MPAEKGRTVRTRKDKVMDKDMDEDAASVSGCTGTLRGKNVVDSV